MPALLLAAEAMTLGEKLSVGWKVCVLGLGMVFFILILLWGILELFRVFFYDMPKRRGRRSSASADAVTATEAVTETVAETAQETASDDGELAAVISAAVAAYLAAETPNGAPPARFRVVSFRRAGR